MQRVSKNVDPIGVWMYENTKEQQKRRSNRYLDVRCSYHVKSDKPAKVYHRGRLRLSNFNLA
ncbi:hypothetical protein J8TS2_38490 [Lederbergia ruris]|uniref:Uncharacterized protein n=1 Tax=Lederbergia ruris TaxID=217495 RepID=A0ABQ4KNL6_9BACI|nr:hypothetical protein J8TS2_38490 [Lederbergia ruris]